MRSRSSQLKTSYVLPLLRVLEVYERHLLFCVGTLWLLGRHLWADGCNDPPRRYRRGLRHCATLRPSVHAPPRADLQATLPGRGCELAEPHLGWCVPCSPVNEWISCMIRSEAREHGRALHYHGHHWRGEPHDVARRAGASCRAHAQCGRELGNTVGLVSGALVFVCLDA